MDYTIVHFDVPSEDVEKLKKFYSELFGWKSYRNPEPVEYWLIETVPVDEKSTPVRLGVNGGMYKRDQPPLESVNYILVDDIDEFIEKTKTLGEQSHNPNSKYPA